MLTSFDSLLTEATAALSEREAEKNKWLRNDGTPCSNYIWKYASKTKQGDAGEAVVRDALSAILSEIYGTVTVEVVNMGKGDFDVHAIIPAIDRTRIPAARNSASNRTLPVSSAQSAACRSLSATSIAFRASTHCSCTAATSVASDS